MAYIWECPRSAGVRDRPGLSYLWSAIPQSQNITDSAVFGKQFTRRQNCFEEGKWIDKTILSATFHPLLLHHLTTATTIPHLLLLHHLHHRLQPTPEVPRGKKIIACWLRICALWKFFGGIIL